MNHIDLTHLFTNHMPVYPGDSIPKLTQVAFFDKDGCNNFHITTGMHVGTHIDAPLHMIKNGKRLSEYAPERFFGTGHLIDARGTVINADLLEGRNILKGDIVFILTGFSGKFGTPAYYKSYPEINADFASRMAEYGVSIVGMDTPSPDRPPFAIHKLLLESGVLIIENLTHLESLVGHEHFTVTALPTKFDSEAAPVRVIAHY